MAAGERAIPSSVRRELRGGMVGACAALLGLSGCQPELTAGTLSCSAAGAPSVLPASTDSVAVPWTTGFEDEFCGYSTAAGFCYANGQASYDIVTSPVHSGRYAAAFRINADDDETHQARCVRQGELPTSAYYSAWYFVPEAAVTGRHNWNLFFFQGGDDPDSRLTNFWNITLIDGEKSGTVELLAYGALIGQVFRPTVHTPIPIGEWFHIEFFLKRAADATGEIALYQNDVQLVNVKNLVTDNGSAYQQWYVGNLADGLTPPDVTLYVDDVSIRAQR